MKLIGSLPNKVWWAARRPGAILPHSLGAWAVAWALCAAPLVGAAADDAGPATARDCYNAGTRLLAAKKFAEAEQMLKASLAAEDEAVQPPALFNLGHVRFADGLEILKQGPDAQKTSAQAAAALVEAGGAIRSGEAALAENQLEKMVTAYLEGRGARRDLRAAEKAVHDALETYGKTLARWQQAGDNFRDAAELNSSDTNATYNARVVDQHIARLVDTLQKMQELAGAMAGQKQQLSKVLSKLKGQIPAPNAPPGGKGEDDEDGEGSSQGDIKPESLAGKEENTGRDGEQIQVTLSPEQAGQMLDGLQVDGNRRLPIGGDQEGEPPKDRHGRIW